MYNALCAVLSKHFDSCIILNSSCIIYSICGAADCISSAFLSLLILQTEWQSKLFSVVMVMIELKHLTQYIPLPQSCRAGQERLVKGRSKHFLMSNVHSIEHYSNSVHLLLGRSSQIETNMDRLCDIPKSKKQNTNPQTKWTYNPDYIKYGLACNNDKHGLCQLQYVLAKSMNSLKFKRYLENKQLGL